jgi:LPS sulfotransferase NodH
MKSALINQHFGRILNPVQSQSNAGPLFVVGVWRSGTSLLQALLNQHPQIGLAYEAELPLLQSLFRKGHAKADWAARWNFWNSALTRHRISLGSIPSGVYDLRTATETVYRKYASQKGATIWGEKSPNYWDRLDDIAREFPSAKFIVIFRNPLGVCRSVFQAAETQDYFARNGMGLRALFACLQLKKQRDMLVKRGVPVCDVQYEELVQDPGRVLKHVCEYLDLPFDARMTTLENADRDSFYEGKHHSMVKGDRIIANQARRDTLPAGFKVKIESYMALWRQQFGDWPPQYNSDPAASDQPNFMERATDSCHFWLLRQFDGLVATIYCWAPLSWLTAYRSRKRREDQLMPSGPSAQSRPL